MGLALRGLRYHWRTNLAVVLAATVSGAVLTGALLVGDSMRGSLRHLLLDQLGAIDEVLVTDRFFRAELAGELAASDDFKEHFSAAVPAVYVQGTLDHPDGSLRAGQVNVIGAGEAFFLLGGGGPKQPPGRGQIVLNEPLAREIGAKAGDEVLLRIGGASQIPADSALGRKTETIRNRRLTVSEIIPAEGLGRFALNPSQLVPLVAYVDTATLQDALERTGKANAIFVGGKQGETPAIADHSALVATLRPKLIDYGLTIAEHELGYVQLASDRMLVEPNVVAAARKAFAADREQEVFTYLANWIAKGDKRVPYSTITAIDFAVEPPLGPFKNIDGETIGPLADDEIVLNSWAAEDLDAEPGDEIEIIYFEPESTHGEVRESTAKFRLKDVVPLEGLAADPDFTPELPGVTDQLSIGDWDPPFPYDSSRVRDKDEQYWDEHRTTPKAFISLAAGRKLWSSRFGDTTSVRFAPPPGPTLQPQAEQLRLEPESLGFIFRPVKRLGLEAAQGTTGFDGLFLGFSLFIMVSSLLLVAILFRLGIEQRAAEIGVLETVGMRGGRIRQILLVEAFVVTLAGSLLGVAAGVGYAWLMLAGLTTWWLSAISTPFLKLYITPTSLIVGFVGGVLVSLLTVLWTLQRLKHISVRRLLAGQAQEDRFSAAATPGTKRWIVAGLLAMAVVSGLSAPWLTSEAQAGAFVGAGALVLAAALAYLSDVLSCPSRRQAAAARLSISRLAARNGARNPGRSVLSVGLIAAASFLIVALSAFRLDPAAIGTGLDSGSGGFALVAQSDAPIYQNLNDEASREQLGLTVEADKLLAKSETVALRVEPGDDASCLNLYQSTQPRVLGASSPLITRGGFRWGSTAAISAEESANPWLLLNKPLVDDRGENSIPAIVDFNTATYSLKKGLGDTIEVTDGAGLSQKLRIVGMLKNSIFQGDVIVSEANLLTLFPNVNGYRFFLVDTREQPPGEVRQVLEDALGDYGFDAESSRDRLAAFFAVQNTYLSTFQSLGGLGLLLGTFGLATVQLRSVLERRGELALMRAAGFRHSLLARMVLLENLILLVSGLALGVLAALVAVLPHWVLGGASIPWLSLAATLAAVLIAGLLASLLAVRATLRAELIPALRAE